MQGKQKYLLCSYSDGSLKSIVLISECPSWNGGSLLVMLTVPLIKNAKNIPYKYESQKLLSGLKLYSPLTPSPSSHFYSPLIPSHFQYSEHLWNLITFSNYSSDCKLEKLILE